MGIQTFLTLEKVRGERFSPTTSTALYIRNMMYTAINRRDGGGRRVQRVGPGKKTTLYCSRWFTCGKWQRIIYIIHVYCIRARWHGPARAYYIVSVSRSPQSLCAFLFLFFRAVACVYNIPTKTIHAAAVGRVFYTPRAGARLIFYRGRRTAAAAHAGRTRTRAPQTPRVEK